MQTRTLITLALSFVATGAFAQFTAGNLVATQVGIGVAAPTSVATRVKVRELTTAGVPVGTDITLPYNVAAGTNFTNSGSATSESSLNLSLDGQYLTTAGYNAIEGTTGIAATTTVARIAARIKFDKTVDLSTSLTDAYVGNNPRSVITDDGSRFWFAGTSSGTILTGAVRAALLGASTSTQVYDPTGGTLGPNNTRIVRIFDLGAGPELYVASASSPWIGISKVGTSPLSVLTGQTVTLLPGMPSTVTTRSPYDFYFADANTLYIADDASIANGGGIQKWTLTAGTWNLDYVLQTGTTVGVRSFAAVKSGSIVTFYAVNNAGTPNKIVTVTDNGAASPFSDVAQAEPFTNFRGVKFAPVAATGGSKTITGAFIDAGFAGSWSPFPGTYEIRSGSSVLDSGTFTLSASGAYSLTIPATVPNGSYDLCIKAGHWLSKKIAISLNGNLSGVDVAPLNGDVDGDDAVTILDYSVLSDSFDKNLGDSGYEASADLDGDESVTILDYSILSDNFDKSGECA